MSQEIQIPVCSFVPSNVVLPAWLDGRCLCGRLLSEHEHVTFAITGNELRQIDV